MVRTPVKRLIEGSQRVARGDLEARIDLPSGGEIGQLASAFNDMTGDLREAREEILGWSRELESRVVEKTGELAGALKPGDVCLTLGAGSVEVIGGDLLMILGKSREEEEI